MSKNVIRWKLSEIMARHRIKGKDLANYLGISANSISALKRAEVMPEIGGERWEQICEAINELSHIDEKCTPFDLIEYVERKNKYDEENPKPLTSKCVKTGRGAA